MKQRANFLYEVTKASLKLQNENSYLGLVWYLLGPLLLFGILLFVFSHRLGHNIQHYPLYLLLGLISWNFFSSATGRAMNTLMANAGIIKSMPVSLAMLISSTVLHSLIVHSIELLVFFGALFFLGVSVHVFSIFLFLITLLLSFLFTLGAGFTLASLYPFFRDLHQIWSVIMRAWWFATPIFYIPTTTGLGSKISLFNPMYYVIHLPRELLVYNRIPEAWMFIVLALFAIVSCIVGYTTLHVMRNRCVELL